MRNVGMWLCLVFSEFLDVVGLRMPRKQGSVQQWRKRNGHLVGQVNVTKTGREVPLALQMDGSGVINVQRSGGEGCAHARVAKLTDGEKGAIF